MTQQNNEVQAALEWYEKYFSQVYGGYIPDLPHHKTIRAALTAQQPEAPRYDPRLGLIQKEPINQELLEAATKLDAELNRRNSYDCQLKTSQVLSDSWPAIKRAIALTAQLTKTDDNVSCPRAANTVDINADLLEALRRVDAVICHELCSSPNKQIADSGELCRSDISKIRRFISRPVDLKELKLKEYNDFKQRVALEQEEDDDTCKRAEQKGGV